MKFLPKTIDSQFLVRVIKNEVGPEEREFFEKWLEESEENKEEFSSLLLLWDKFQYSHLPLLPSQEEQWEKMETVISCKKNPSPALSAPSFSRSADFEPLKKTDRRKDIAIWIFRAAAVLIISLIFYFTETSNKKNAVPPLVKNESSSILPLKYYSLVTAKGEKSTLNLSDGSVIQLNSESKLRYPNYFETSVREVELEGEGYFKISKDPKRPFRVKCNNTITEVTGTEFNIKSRADNLSITVVKGSVKTFSSIEKKGVAVTRGEMVVLRSSGNFSKPVKVNLKHLTAWRENKIFFSRTPLSLAAEELERCYSNVDIIIISDSLKQKTITGIFNTNSLDEILSVLSLTMDIRISKNGNKIYFE